VTRQIEQFGMVLRRLITGSTRQQEPAQASNDIAAAHNELCEILCITQGAFLGLGPEELIHRLRSNPSFSEANADLLADLLVAFSAADKVHARQHVTQALAILQHLNATSKTFDPERQAKVARLRALV
jgi:hypothetical protein